MAIAGGFTQQARHSQVVVFRWISAYVAESHVIDVKKCWILVIFAKIWTFNPATLSMFHRAGFQKFGKFVPTNSRVGI